MKLFRLFILMLLLASVGAGYAQDQGIIRLVFSAGERHLTVEILDDDLVHFELSQSPSDDGLWTSPMIAKTDYQGASVVNQPAPNVIETADLQLSISDDLCVTITDLTREPALVLTTICPPTDESDQTHQSLSLTAEGVTDIYGLGEQFQRRGGTDGNWFGGRRVTLNNYGNSLVSFEGGKVGSAQFPIMYALGAGHDNYALFLDDIYQQYWAFNDETFTIETANDVMRWYVMTGADLPDLRADYLELVGRPPVPPKQMFGLWVSEYGYEDWAELEGKLTGLRAENFPLDGFVLDLFWFGGIGEDNGIGGLAWDEENFPNPAGYIADLRQDHGLGLMVVEEAYVASTLSDYDSLVEQNMLVRSCADVTCPPVTMNSWWGDGGMVDFSDLEIGARWHDLRRQHLVDSGIIGHWTDLGEPENYVETAYYHGLPEFGRHGHADVHNIYNLLWSQSIFDGYMRSEATNRPFVMSRSGTSGSQRHGVAMWSGDIAANMPSLTAHMNVQMHMALSGIDYFGADIGGFYRNVFDPILGQDGMYSLWLANASLLDVPLRPHAQNLQNIHETSPAQIGDIASNLANIRLRYALSPYLYTLAHQAYRTGEAVFPPLVYHFQDDLNVRKMGSQKMLGEWLMMATVTGYPVETIPVYLPAGTWFDFYSHTPYQSAGETFDMAFKSDEGLLRVPLLARDGAIIPQMVVDDETFNILGLRADGTVSHDLAIDVYLAEAESGEVTLIEDDGATMAYQDGAVRETSISFVATGESVTITIHPVQGAYQGAPDARRVMVRLITPEGIFNEEALVDAQSGVEFVINKGE